MTSRILLQPPPLLGPYAIPQGAWGNNARTRLTGKAWDAIRRQVAATTGARCAVCQHQEIDCRTGKTRLPHCHEEWTFTRGTEDNPEHLAQTLTRLVPLCGPCHSTQHLRNSTRQGRWDIAVEQLARVNGWTTGEATARAEDAVRASVELDHLVWNLDLSLIGCVRMSEVTAGADPRPQVFNPAPILPASL
ncbi:hypothetical protein [Streptomyces sp. CS014]|uniref:hypothetical protein n=1 Tax=Streptomyces sp. CS014 TaxID=2162707 RepID=UPI000D50D07F|nr:hypothetical protein [Streptomyces sp. CS014]PVD04492.1 hypothetical protein DBP12_03440 [Streptomyces sp. CS014]